MSEWVCTYAMHAPVLWPLPAPFSFKNLNFKPRPFYWRPCLHLQTYSDHSSLDDLSWLKPSASIHHHQIQLPAPTMSLLSGEGVTPFNYNYSVKNLDSPLPPTAPEPPHLSETQVSWSFFSKYLLFCPFLSMPLSWFHLWHSHCTGVPLLCVDLCSWDPTWEWLPLPSYSSFYHHT